jgi:hypothetical protein
MLIGRCSSQLSGHRKLKKSQPLSVAPHRLIACHNAFGAESKDLGGAYLTHAAGSFPTTDVVLDIARCWQVPGSRSRRKNRGRTTRCGLRWLKSSKQPGQDKHRRGPSTPLKTGSSAPRHKRCITRSICEALRSEAVTFLISCGRKAAKSICQ